MNEIPSSELQLSHFSELLGETFYVVDTTAGRIDLRLLEARGCARAGQGALSKIPSVGEAFSVVFAGPAATFLSQGMYSFEHGKLGRFVLFIVPIGRDGGEFRYEAVFNRA